MPSLYEIALRYHACFINKNTQKNKQKAFLNEKINFHSDIMRLFASKKQTCTIFALRRTTHQRLKELQVKFEGNSLTRVEHVFHKLEIGRTDQ